jgi:hypothetical protein
METRLSIYDPTFWHVLFHHWNITIYSVISERYPDIRWTEAHGMMRAMGGLKVVKEDDPDKERMNFKDLDFKLYEVDFSTFTEEDIWDKSKQDRFAKLLVVLQASWFSIQCAARVALGLPVTALELTTLAHTSFVAIIYFIWWNKPLDVRSPITIQAKLRKDCGTSGEVSGDSVSEEVSQGVAGIDEPEGSSTGIHTNSLLPKASTVNGSQYAHQLSWRIRLGTYPPIFKSVVWTAGDWALFTTLVIGSCAFGIIHCLGWNSYFPSHVEQIFWRVAAVMITLLLAAVMFTFRLNFEVGKRAVYIFGPLYICARISLITLAFLALRDLPFPAYQTLSWINFIPHL